MKYVVFPCLTCFILICGIVSLTPKIERFWHFQPIYTLADIDEIVKPGETASLGKMKKVIKYAYLDNELFNIIQEPYGRTELFTVLKQFLY